MAPSDTQQELSDLIAELQEEDTLACVQRLIDGGVGPLIIFDLCHAGLARVGEFYEKGRYAISGLIMAGEIMRQIGQIAKEVELFLTRTIERWAMVSVEVLTFCRLEIIITKKNNHPDYTLIKYYYASFQKNC